MANIKDIISACKQGHVAEAYASAKASLDAAPRDVWAQRGMGWAVYYAMKLDLAQEDSTAFMAHLEDLAALDLLTAADDSMLFDNVAWKLAERIKLVPDNQVGVVDSLFSAFSRFSFGVSKGYSFLLKSCLRFETWGRLLEFLEWWNLDNLMPEDYQPFELRNGKKSMSLAERAYIACAKALLRRGDKERICRFLPKMEALANDYPDMTYPGYFCGKLMIATRENKKEALGVLMPFVRKKSSEFWIWQLLSEIHAEEPDVSLACLLRAVHSKAKESFLGKVRMNLVAAYVARGDYERAKFHLDKLVSCYKMQGWHLPFEMQCQANEPWVRTTLADGSDGVDYMQLTNEILTIGTRESVAAVTFVDRVSKLATLVYGEKMQAMVRLQSLRTKVAEGALLKIYWLPDAKKGIAIVWAKPTSDLPPGCTYIKRMAGTVARPAGKPFAFVKGQGASCFVTPMMVQKHHLVGGETVAATAAYSYNKRKDAWSWVVASIALR